MRIWESFPLLVVPVAVYNAVAWGGPLLGAADTSACADRMGYPVHPLACWLAAPLVRIPMASSLELDGTLQRVFWGTTTGDLLMVVTLVLLFLEILKSTTSRSSSVLNHGLSLGVFVLALVEFLLFPAFATSVFFLITLTALLDVLAGFIVTIATSRRDLLT